MDDYEQTPMQDAPEFPDQDWQRLEETAPDSYTGAPGSWEPRTLDDMAWLAERAAWHARQFAAQEAATKARIERERAWLDNQRTRYEDRISWYEQHAVTFMQRHRAAELEAGVKPDRLTKTLSLPGGVGKVTARMGRDRFDVTDEALAITWAQVNDRPDLLDVKTTVKKAPLAALLKETGEIPDGIEHHPAEVTFKLELPK